jgi:hypothetical protein
MADDTSASIIPLHHRPPKARPKTGAERAKAYRDRKRQKARTSDRVTLERLPADSVTADRPVTLVRAVTPERVTPAPRSAARIVLSVAALALAGVGIMMNGWFARSLGSSDVAGWLFLGVGVAADVVALVMPSCAAGLWRERHRATAVVGWGVWDLRLCRDGGHRIRLAKHRGRDGGARVTRDAGCDGGASGIE